MSDLPDIAGQLADVIAHYERHGVMPSNMPPAIASLAASYLQTMSLLDGDQADGEAAGPSGRHSGSGAEALPAIEGFRTIERIGGGGMGEVYKLQDLRLDRIVAAKIIRRDRLAQLPTATRDFLREAKSLALFSDPRVVQIFECRLETEPAVIIMEFVEGFELGRLGPSLEFRQRAKIVRDVAETLERAHALGIQHRDLKPSNIMLDAALGPKILDFGLSDGDPSRGHLRGTLHYIAPEQLDPAQPIDRRSDVYALGVILYELCCGTPPYSGETTEAILDAVRRGVPRLPVEIVGDVPLPLQAIALKAMERQPSDRYQTAAEMARELDRYLSGQPVLARPTVYATTLGSRIRPHLQHVEEWLRLKLIYPHEASRLMSAYKALEAREDDWIVTTRALSYSQIALYLGAFFLFAGSLFYFDAHRVEKAVTGLTGPVLVLGLPFVGLNVAGRWLYRRNHQAVAVAFYLAGVTLLPLFLLIVLQERHLWMAPENSARELIESGWVSNRQLQITAGITCLWSSWLAFRTRTTALSTLSILLGFLTFLAILTDFGLRTWLEESQLDRLSLHLAPLIAIYAVAGIALERSKRDWFARPAFAGAALMLVVVLELLAQHGKLFHYLGISMAPLLPADVSDPEQLPTLTALALNGAVFYLVAAAIDKYGTQAMTAASGLLFVVAPFLMLEPLAAISEAGVYHPRFDWFYLTLAVGIAILSQRRQRKSFYYAGVVNAGVALYLIALRHDWFKRPAWAISLVAAGLVALGVGFVIDAYRRRSE